MSVEASQPDRKRQLAEITNTKTDPVEMLRSATKMTSNSCSSSSSIPIIVKPQSIIFNLPAVHRQLWDRLQSLTVRLEQAQATFARLLQVQHLAPDSRKEALLRALDQEIEMLTRVRARIEREVAAAAGIVGFNL